MTSTLFDKLLARLTAPAADHPRFVGAPLEIHGLTARELGRLWPHLQRLHGDLGNPAGAEAARSILQQAQALDLVPALDQDSALECFRHLQPGELTKAIDVLVLMEGRPTSSLAQEARRVLGELATCTANRLQAAVLARLAGGAMTAELEAAVAQAFAASPLVVQEFSILNEVSDSAMLAFASSPFIAYFGPQFHPDAPDPAAALAEEPAYVVFAEATLRDAARRLQDIHAGTLPYVADGAFTVDDAAVIARAARVALLRDESWSGEIMGRLLPLACVAPGTAKTTPSQSLAIALGHSIESAPTPESVLALREALKVVRHAGVTKKLSRNLKPAERALADRPELALRLASAMKFDKRQATVLATCLEAGLWRDLRLDWQAWRERLLSSAAGAGFGTTLIWHAHLPEGGCSFRVEGKQLIDVKGHEVVISDTTLVSLWHPASADPAECEAWQSWVTERQVRQPLRQAFREHYAPKPDERGLASSGMFAGHVLSARQLIGLARREGWRIDKFDGLIRTFGDVRVCFHVDPGLYPGAEGDCLAQGLFFQKRDRSRWVPVAVGELPPALFSEACRAVDLLVSVASFALHDETLPATRPLPSPGQPRLKSATPTQMSRMRHAVLRHLFARHISEGHVVLGERHLQVGDFDIHLSTARVTRAGAAVEIERPPGPPLHAVPWLPYDERLLQRIVDTARELLAFTRAAGRP